MERIVLVNCAVLCVVLFLFEAIVCVPHNYGTSLQEGEKSRDSEPYLWFGPRLGRRKRNNAIAEDHADSEREQIATLLDFIQDSPWAIVAVNEGKRNTVSFTPRLGRESGEDMVSGDRWLQQDPEMTGELLSQRSPPFAPRLGRRLSPYSPRLGRESTAKAQMP